MAERTLHVTLRQDGPIPLDVHFTCGTGDTLAGLIGALACALPPARAAAAGAFLHGLASDRWRARTGADRGLLASEIADEIPALLGELLASR